MHINQVSKQYILPQNKLIFQICHIMIVNKATIKLLNCYAYFIDLTSVNYCNHGRFLNLQCVFYMPIVLLTFYVNISIIIRQFIQWIQMKSSGSKELQTMLFILICITGYKLSVQQGKRPYRYWSLRIGYNPIINECSQK